MASRNKPARGRRRLNGEGTVSGPRKDGRYVGAFYAPTTAGTRRRVYVSTGAPAEAYERLVEARDTQIILGHAHVSTTQQIYTYVDEAAQRDALTRLNKLLGGGE
jgi:integrase